MDVLHARCAGLDVHKETVVACVRLQRGRRVEREAQTFGTTTAELLRLGDWLEPQGCTAAVLAPHYAARREAVLRRKVQQCADTFRVLLDRSPLTALRGSLRTGVCRAGSRAGCRTGHSIAVAMSGPIWPVDSDTGVATG